jgi:hypothetical protein
MYFNGKRYVRQVRATRDFAGRRRETRITFAYRGITAEWPAVIHYAFWMQAS